MNTCRNPRLLASVAGLAAVLSLSAGCSTRQAYDSGQAWQRQECNKYPDPQERARCQSSASTSYEDYQRQSEAAKNPRKPQ